MKYVCEPFSSQIADLEAERKNLQEQLATAESGEQAGLQARIAEIDRELPGLQQSLADCLAHKRHFSPEAPDPSDPHKR